MDSTANAAEPVETLIIGGGQGGAGPGGAAGGPGGGPGSDKVVDADFEEVDDQKKRGSA